MPVKKNILLINPWIFDFTAYDFWLKPLGLLIIAAFLKRCGNFHLSYIDCMDRHHPSLNKPIQTKEDGRGAFSKEEVKKPEILKRIPRKYSRYGISIDLFLHELDQVVRPDIVLMTCTMTYWYPGVQLAIELVKKKFGSVPVILGGIYASLCYNHAKANSGADVICSGPGERKIHSILKDVLGDHVCSEPFDKFANDSLIPEVKLLRDKTTLPLMTSRGCPLNCYFCASSLLFDGFVQRSPLSVINEIRHHYQLFHNQHIAFYDDALCLNKHQHIIPILEGIIREDLPVNFHAPNGLHVREIDENLALLFKRAKFETIFLSQDSFEEGVLEKSCDKVKPGDLENSLECLEKAGYLRQNMNVYLLVGLPGQHLSEVMDAISRIRDLAARPRLAYFSPVPGTEIWKDMLVKGNLLSDADPLLHNKLVFPYFWKGLSPEDFRTINNYMKTSGA